MLVIVLVINFISWAVNNVQITAIDSVTPLQGSTIGGNITITGKYFYNDANVPAKIEIGSQPCDVINFDMSNLPQTTLVCNNLPKKQTKTEYYGNRGITMTRDNIYTPFASMATSSPSSNAQTRIIDQASYTDTKSVDVTIWLIGFFNPKKDSTYEFTLNTNSDAQVYLSTDSTSANKSLVSSYSNAVSFNKTVDLKANEKYYYLH